MAKALRYEYYDINGFENLASVEMANLTEFIRLLSFFEIKIVFRENITAEPPAYTLFCQHGNMMYFHRNSLWKHVEDYEDARTHGFEQARDYYEAVSLGFSEFKDFDECRKSGLTDRTLFNRAQQGGFIDGYSRLQERLAGERSEIYYDAANELKQIQNAIELLGYAEKKGFVNYKDFERAVVKGYRTLAEHQEGNRLGFDFGSDYRKAIRAGFDNFSEYNEANHQQIHTKKEYTIYKKLKGKSKYKGMDEVVLMEYIATLPNGKKIPLNKLEDQLRELLKQFQVAESDKNNDRMPGWFTRKLLGRNEVVAFLASDKDVRPFGIYDSEGEYFEVFKIRESKVFVDASNVAHYGKEGKSSERPEMRKVWQVARALLDQRFPHVVVIADASLKHRVSDLKNKKMVEQICTYHEAPAGSSADEFLINMARKENGFIVTNDTFRDWKQKEPWVADHIDEIRIPFMIQNELVSFSLMEKFGAGV